MGKNVQYQVITGTCVVLGDDQQEEFESTVRVMLSGGWEPVGGVSLITGQDRDGATVLYFAQAILYRGDADQESEEAPRRIFY